MPGFLKKRMTATLTLDVPEGVSNRELREYVADALASWGGSGDPDAPLFAGVKVRKFSLDPDYRLVNVRRWHA